MHFFFLHSKTIFAYDFQFSILLENFILHQVSMSLHASCMRYKSPHMQSACGVIDTACKSKILIFFVNSNLYAQRLKSLNQGPRTDVLIKKIVENLVTLSLFLNKFLFN
jgi:hypothetical protein